MRGFVQGPVHLFGRLRCHREGSIGECRHDAFEPVSTRDTARGVDENSLFHRGTGHPWKQDADGRPLKGIRDAGALRRAAHDDASGAFGALQILV